MHALSCRACESITCTGAGPTHKPWACRPEPLGRGRLSKNGRHLPLHRQIERFAREGVPIEIPTPAGWVGAVTTALAPLAPLTALIEVHVRGGERIHLGDTPAPVLAKDPSPDAYLNGATIQIKSPLRHGGCVISGTRPPRAWQAWSAGARHQGCPQPQGGWISVVAAVYNR